MGRVYDTYEMEKNLNDLQKIMLSTFEKMPKDRRWSSLDLCRQVGRDIDRPGIRGIMVAAYRAGVPAYIPAFTDSELGLDLAPNSHLKFLQRPILVANFLASS